MAMKIGDFCWAKLKGFPLWPAKIVEAPSSIKYPNSKENYNYLYFFGSNNYAWVQNSRLASNSDALIEEASTKKSKTLLKAVREFLKEYQEEYRLKEKCDEYYRKKIIKKCYVKIQRLNAETQFNDVVQQGIPKKGIFSEKTSTLTEELCENQATDYPNKSKRFGFIGFGGMERGIVNNLLQAECNITVWNNTCSKYMLNGVKQISYTLTDLISNCDIILCSGYDDVALESVVLEDDGVLQVLNSCNEIGKDFVLLANVDLKISVEIANKIRNKGGKYLEASLLGSEKRFTDGHMHILAAGDEALFTDCETILKNIGNPMYLGSDVEQVSKLSVIAGLYFNAINKTYEESKSLVQKLGLPIQEFNQLLEVLLNKESFKTYLQDPIGRKFDGCDRMGFFINEMKLKYLSL